MFINNQLSSTANLKGLFNNPGKAAQKELCKSLFSHVFLPKTSQSMLSDIASDSIYTVADYTSLYRAGFDLTATLFTDFKNLVGTGDFNLVYQIFGLPSGLGAVVGANGIRQDISSIAYHEAIQDKTGSLLKRVSLAKNSVFFSAATCYAIYRPLAVIAEVFKQSYADFKAPTLLGRLAYGFQLVGAVLYAIFFTLGSFVFGFNLFQEVKFFNHLAKAKTPEEQMSFLLGKIQVDPNKIFQKLVEKEGSKEKAIEALVKQAYQSSKGHLGEITKELGKDPLHEAQICSLIKEVITNGPSFLSKDLERSQSAKEIHQLTTDTVDDKLALVGLQMKMQMLQLKKNHKMQRVLTSSGCKALQELANKQIGTSDKAVSTCLIEKIKTSNFSAIKREIAWLSLFIFGTISMILAATFVEGAGLLLSAIVMLAFSVMTMAADIYCLAKSYKKGAVGEHDKQILWASTAIAIASLFTVVALGASGVISMGTAPVIIGLILATIWVAQNIATLAVIYRSERLYKENNPTLALLLKAFEQNQTEDLLEKMVANLSKEEKLLLHKVWAENQPLLTKIFSLFSMQPQIIDKDVVTQAIHKVEEVKEKRWSLLRQSLENLEFFENKQISA